MAYKRQKPAPDGPENLKIRWGYPYYRQGLPIFRQDSPHFSQIIAFSRRIPATNPHFWQRPQICMSIAIR
jgi:hypothetical protein